jgi:hypothetical protein
VGGTCGTHGGGQRCLQVFFFFVSLKGKRPLGTPRRRWEDNIKLDLREIGIDGANRIQLDQNRVQWRAFVSTLLNLPVP